MLSKYGNMTRRGFLTRTTAGVAALSAASALAGCSKNDAEQLYYPGEDGGFEPVQETVYPGAAYHNCKGRCMVKAHVKNGVIRRFSTDDENPDTDLNPQLRSCLRCRSYRMKLYGPGRLMYPLVYAPDEPSAERGDMSKFKRVSWKEAMDYIKRRYDQLRTENGSNMHTLVCQGTGMYGRFQNKDLFMRVVNQAMGGSSTFWGQASFNAGTYVFGTVAGTTHAHLQCNPESMTNAKTIILWGSNAVNSTGGTNVAYWLVKAREKGARVIYIGPLYNKTAEIADEFIPLKPGTDTALMLAMMHEMLDKGYLDEDLVGKFAVGFFDNPGGTTPPQISGKESTVVPAGRSLSAYIYGKNRQHPKNSGVCNYPINETSTKYPYKASFLAEKTPEWAAPITGISAEKIKELAKLYAVDGKPCAIRSSIGLQRQPNGVANCWLLMTLCLITGNFGLQGTGLKMHYYGVSANPVGGLGSVPNSGTNPETRRTLCHLSLLMDAIRAKGNPATNSRWKFDAELMSVNKPVKIILSYGGNSVVNQQADPFSAIEQLKDRSNVGLIINVDNVMTPSARWSDVVLPGDTHFEREDVVTDQNYMLYQPKVIEPMGEIKANVDIAIELGKAFNLSKTDIYPENKSYSELIEEMWYNADRGGMSFNEFKKTGIYRIKTNEPVVESAAIRNHGSIDNSNKLNTATGYWEIYSDQNVTRYETRNEIGLSSPLTQSNADQDGDREVIEIPYWMDFTSYHYPLYSGIYGGLPALSNPDTEYPFMCLAQHSLWRTHSNHSGISYLRELYKQDGKGNPAYDHNTYSVADWQENGATNVFPRGYGQPSGYEPIWINPNDATQYQDGQLVKVTSAGTRRSIIAAIHKTERCMPGTLVLEQGSWFDPVELADGTWVDRGGCSSTLITEMPTIGDRGPSMMLSAVKLEAFDESQYK